ncbi:hypothetical protein EU528_11155 [Candidatus Thorarchaeota archaeon]|nr:MAG: hypothetical protein EU528_11155 [Candidatus Thorarchaeota archaeon]
MKQKRFDELVQNGYIAFMSLFIVFVLLALMLDNEILMWLSVIMLLYIPAVVCAYCIQGANESLIGWKKKRNYAKRLAECTSFRCKTCERIYKKEELDISATSVLTCPQCNQKLVPAD